MTSAYRFVFWFFFFSFFVLQCKSRNDNFIEDTFCTPEVTYNCRTVQRNLASSSTLPRFRIIVQNDFRNYLSNFNVYSFLSSLNCDLFLASLVSLSKEVVYSTKVLEQSSRTVCYANFSMSIYTNDLFQDTSLRLVLHPLNRIPSFTYIVFRDPIIPYTLPLFVNSIDQIDDLTLSYILTVQIFPNMLRDSALEACRFNTPGNLGENTATLTFLNASSSSLCEERTLSIIEEEQESDFFFSSTNFSLTELVTSCFYNRVIDTVLRLDTFQFAVQASFPDCSFTTNYQPEPLLFEFTIPSSIGNNEGGRDGGRDVSHEVKFILENARFIPCDDRAGDLPEVKIQFTVDVILNSFEDENDAIELNTYFFGDIPLLLVSNNSSEESNRTRFVFETLECVLIRTLHNSSSIERKEDSNWIGCELPYIPPLTLTYDSEEDQVDLNSVHTFLSNTHREECPINATRVFRSDIVQTYETEISFLNNRFNLNSFIELEISVLNSLLPSQNVYIDNIVVNLDNEFERTFNPITKFFLLFNRRGETTTTALSSYAFDATFCKLTCYGKYIYSIVDAQDEDMIGFCNNLTRSNDRFRFIPRNWIFNNFDKLRGNMRITIFGSVGNCPEVYLTESSSDFGRRRQLFSIEDFINEDDDNEDNHFQTQLTLQFDDSTGVVDVIEGGNQTTVSLSSMKYIHSFNYIIFLLVFFI